MIKVATKLVPLVVLVAVGTTAAYLTGTVNLSDMFGNDGKRPGNRIRLYASSTGTTVIVEARVESSVRGIIYQTEPNYPVVMHPPFLQEFLVENGETLTGIVNAGVTYPGHSVVVTCAVTADTGNIEGGHDMATKRSAEDPPDVHCRGSVSSPPA